MKEIVECEVLVIGGGGAGTRAALEAYASGAAVTIAVKGRFALSGVRGAGATGFRGGGRPLHLFSSPMVVGTSGDEPGGNEPGYYHKVPFRPDEEQEVYFGRAIQAGGEQGIV